MDITPQVAFDPSAARATTVRALENAINHVFLPPRTPQADDSNIGHEHYLISLLVRSISTFSTTCSTADAERLVPVGRMLERLLRVKPGRKSKDKRSEMRAVMQELEDGGT